MDGLAEVRGLDDGASPLGASPESRWIRKNMSLTSLAEFEINSDNPFKFVVKIKNSKGWIVTPIFIFILGGLGYFQSILARAFVSGIFSVINGYTVLIGITEKTSHTWIYVNPIFWVGFQATIAAFFFALLFPEIFILQEIAWRIFGKETIEVSKNSIEWSRQIPFKRLAKTFPVLALKKMKVWNPEFVEKIDKIRPHIVIFHGMGNGAIELEYETQTVQIGGLITSVQAKSILSHLKNMYYLDVPVEL